MSNLIPTCIHCKKPLKNQTCFACDGNGYSREFLLVHKECNVCKGTGKLWRCEDEFKHIVEDFKNTHKVNRQPISQNLHKAVPHIPAPLNTQPKPPTPPQIPPPWHPSFPSPFHPMHPENPWNFNNIHSPFNRYNPMNPNSPFNINNPQNLNSPKHPFNRNNPTKK